MNARLSVSLTVVLGFSVLLRAGAVQTGLAPRPAPAIDASSLLRDLEVLASRDMEGRKPGTAGHERARRYIVRRFKESGLEPLRGSYEHAFTLTEEQDGGQREPRRGVNVAGAIRGSRQHALSIVITAHYDHLGIRDGNIFYGADDNASGTAALFALASHFRKEPPQHTLVFAALDAEESGLWGARAFVERPPIDLEAVVMNVNMDMLGRDPANTLYAVGTSHYPFLKPYLERVAARAPVKLAIGHDGPGAPIIADWTRESDHFPFHSRGIPFVYFGVENTAHHHKRTDTVASIARKFYVNAVATVAAALQEFDANAETIKRQSR